MLVNAKKKTKKTTKAEEVKNKKSKEQERQHVKRKQVDREMQLAESLGER